MERDHFGIVRENGRAIKMGITQTGPDDIGLVVGYYEHEYEPAVLTPVHSTFGSFKVGNFSNRGVNSSFSITALLHQV